MTILTKKYAESLICGGTATSQMKMNESQRLVYCNGHHERMRGIQRNEAPQSDIIEWMQSIWLDGWDSADGELYDRAISGLRSVLQILHNPILPMGA